jgi:2-succinyl-5-enolpyruvyl-6-hydroxy-3-cyclohexene-1-carboxylate synthase
MQVPSPRLAVAIVEELIAGGVRDAVVAPGSRSAPLALALADAERSGLVRLHVRIDERSAGYLALGLARVSGDPVAVITTSGTAAVNVHPAFVEAAYSGVPLIAVTADRPGALRGTGANQTIDQRGIYGVDPVVAEDLEGLDERAVKDVVAAALATATGDRLGPVHLNAPFSEPLVGAGEHVVGDVTRRPRGGRQRTKVPLATLVDAPAVRGLLIAGDFDDEGVLGDASFLASAMGWPVISEPSGNLSSHPLALKHGPLLLGSPWAGAFVPDVVVTIGRVGLHRSVSRVLRDAPIHIAVDVPPSLGRVDPVQSAQAIVDAVPVGAGPVDPQWAAHWRAADDVADRVVINELGVRGAAGGPTALTGPLVARLVAETAREDDLIVIGPSWPVRHMSLYGGVLRATCIANRGTSGIDGVLSTAWGAAVAWGDGHPSGTTYALVGDLTAIYDRNALIAPARESLPQLVYVVADNDGGGIFSQLEQGAADFAADFERVFGTAHGADLSALLAAPRVEIVTVETAGALQDELARTAPGVRIVIARCTPRESEAALVRELQSKVDAALS